MAPKIVTTPLGASDLSSQYPTLTSTQSAQTTNILGQATNFVQNHPAQIDKGVPKSLIEQLAQDSCSDVIAVALDISGLNHPEIDSYTKDTTCYDNSQYCQLVDPSPRAPSSTRDITSNSSSISFGLALVFIIGSALLVGSLVTRFLSDKK